MKKGRQFWKDLSIVFSMVWINLTLFFGLMLAGTLLLKASGAYPQASWPGLILDAFHMAITERVANETDSLVPIILSFLLPLGAVVILGEGALRVFSIYLRKRENREEWDMMVARTYRNHIVVCGVGELGKALIRRFHADHPDARIVLVDTHPGLLLETGISGEKVVCLQADMTNMETLRNASCQNARLILLTSGNDAVNLETAYKVIQLNPDAELWVRLHHYGLADLMDLARKPNLHFFSPYQQAAEAIASHLLQAEDKKAASA